MIVETGQLRGAFNGFHDRNTLFQFNGGGIWRQCEYHYLYHYAYMPEAKIVERNGDYYIEVDGVEESIQVVKVR